jgi:hypothetical protein
MAQTSIDRQNYHKNSKLKQKLKQVRRIDEKLLLRIFSTISEGMSAVHEACCSMTFRSGHLLRT